MPAKASPAKASPAKAPALAPQSIRWQHNFPVLLRLRQFLLAALVAGPALSAAAPAPAAPAPAAAAAPAPAGTGRMLQQLESGDWILQAEALHYLRKHRVMGGVRATGALLANETARPWIRGRALVTLSALENKVPAEFEKWLSHARPELRAAAAEVLEEEGGDQAAAWLQTLLKDPDETVRYQAAATHARRSKEAAWAVVDPLTAEGTAGPARLAARALAWTGTDAALQRLAALMAKPEQLSKCLQGIRDIPSPHLVPLILAARAVLPEGEERLHGLILTDLQHRDKKDLVAGLGKFIEAGGDQNIRTAARVMTLLAPAPELGEPLRTALAKVTDTKTIEAGMIALGIPAIEPARHVDYFTQRLGHADPAIRALAIRCLAHCEGVNLFEILKPKMADENVPVVIAALGALLRSPPANAPRGTLVTYLQSPIGSADNAVRALANEVLAHAGSSDDYQPALATLSGLLRGKDDELRAAAAKALGELAPSGEVGDLVSMQGYLAKWTIIGTFLNDDKNSGFQEVFPPEKAIDFEASYPSQFVWAGVQGGVEGTGDNQPIDREVAWSKVNVDQADGRLLMAANLPPPGSLSIGYAVSDVTLENEREVTLAIDGDDGFRVWLNGAVIGEQMATPDPKTGLSVASVAGVKVPLKQGSNRFLVKSSNITGPWWVRIRVTDADGNPVDFHAPKP
ncbi:MAG: HEAT repeat domain-containing protein [Verrucomicrobiales bacterium]